MTVFHPPTLLKNRHIQSICASTGPRRVIVMHRAQRLLASSNTLFLDGGNSETESSIRLQAELSLHPDSKGMVILLHGWEGSANSLYLLSAGSALFNEGYSICRLNLRDHGPTHHLNRELFNSTRIAEVVHAIGDLQKKYPQDNNFLAGYSLGGNFSLRIALRAPENHLQLNKVVAICPVINPAKTTRTLSNGWWVYHKYFVRKWQTSLAKKLSHFPELGYGHILPKLMTLDEMNDYFVPNFTPYKTTAAYFSGYAIDNDILKNLSIPSHLIATEDDPVIAIEDLKNISQPESLTIEIHKYGGHCGFINSYSLDSWIDDRLVQLFKEARPESC